MKRDVELQSRQIFFSNLFLIQWRSLRLVYSCSLDRSWLTGFESLSLFDTDISCLVCLGWQTVDYVVIRTMDPTHQSLQPRSVTALKVWGRWKHKFLCCPSLLIIYCNDKSQLLRFCPGELMRHLCKYVCKTSTLSAIALFKKLKLEGKELMLWCLKNASSQWNLLLFPSSVICLIMEHFSQPCFNAKQEFENSISYNATTSL